MDTKKVQGLWIAAPMWVAHAASVEEFVANMIVGNEVNESIGHALNPDRFKGRDAAELGSQALSIYNNFYNSTH
jgi:hypothetical protein